jgi:hypothetical protein
MDRRSSMYRLQLDDAWKDEETQPFDLELTDVGQFAFDDSDDDSDENDLDLSTDGPVVRIQFTL